MNRRELLGTSAGIMLAGVMPAWTASYNKNPLREWTTNETTALLHEAIIKGLSRVVSEKSVHAISALDWNLLSDRVVSLGNVYGQLGNHHYADDFVRVNQSEIRNKYGSEAVQIILDKGWHYHMHWAAGQFDRVAQKMRSPDAISEFRVCELAMAGVAFDYLALAFALDPITAPAAPALGFIGLGIGIASLFLC